MLKSVMRKILRQILRYYPIEYGKYSILQRLYFPYLAPIADCGPECVLMNAGFKMYLKPTELLQSHLYLFSTYELPTTRFIARYLAKGDNVLDVGANIGYMSMFCAKIIGFEGKVFAFEPERRNYQLLEQHIELNALTNIYPQHVAATSSATILRLYLAAGNNGAHSTIFNPRELTPEYEEVQGIPLDRFVEEQHIANISLVKIDVEGAEYEVLQGMQSILRTRRPVVIIEFNESLQQQRGLSVDYIKEQLLREYQYAIFSTNEWGFLKAEHSKDFENSICIPTEKIPNIHHLFAH